MKVIDENFSDVKNSNNYVALGSFDGLHQGHMTLIKKIIHLAKDKNGKSLVYTFKNHPRSLIFPEQKQRLLMSNDEKIKFLDNCGVDYLVLEEFTKEYMTKSSEDFVKDLVNTYNVKGIVVGFNYKFGHKNLGDTKLLHSLSEKYNYSLYVMDPKTIDNIVVSSTEIRNFIQEGKVEEANRFLDRPYALEGEVVHGRKIGRTIGFPTANIEVTKDKILPKIGVYYTNVLWNGNLYKGITSVGNNPTVNGVGLSIETYILGINSEIYGENITVFFIKKIRDERKFNSIDELKERLKIDRDFAESEKLYAKY